MPDRSPGPVFFVRIQLGELMTSPREIADQLRRDIREGQLQPGEALIQLDLAERFKVSRNPIREALRILASEGLVDMRSGTRARVRKFGAEDLLELYELRMLIEASLVPHIVDGARRRDITALRELTGQMREQHEMDEWLRSNYLFHDTLYSLSGRRHSATLCRNLLSASQPYSYRNVASPGGREQADYEHEQMLVAIEAGDSPRLTQLFHDHLNNALQRLRNQVFTEPTP